MHHFEKKNSKFFTRGAMRECFPEPHCTTHAEAPWYVLNYKL